MVVRWYNRDAEYRLNLLEHEHNKLILKSLLSNVSFDIRAQIYLNRKFNKFTKVSSIAFYRRSCLRTGFTRSVFRRFKLVRHFCKCYACNGSLTGLRKASF